MTLLTPHEITESEFPSLDGVNRIYTYHGAEVCDFIYNNSPYVVSISDMDTMYRFAEFLAANNFTHNRKAFDEMKMLVYERKT